MINIRDARRSDESSLYRISLGTGDAGQDATGIYADPKLMGHIYSAPYLRLSPDLAFVAGRDDQVLGFCVGVENTMEFVDRLEADWWPELRSIYPKPDQSKRSTWTADERRCHMIHAPEITPMSVAKGFPAHLHMNLLPAIQGQGIGSLLFAKWMERAKQFDVPAAHVGVNEKNERALQFWHKLGFERLETDKSRAVWLGRKLV